MQLFTAQLTHLDQLTALFEGYRIFYRKKPDAAAAKAFLQARLTQQDSVIFVAKEGEKLVGFVQLYPLFSSTRMQKMWLLNDLFVAPTHRGKGISKALINQAKAHCKATNACGLQLETEKNNDIGNQLYPATDFELDIEHNYYFWTNQ